MDNVVVITSIFEPNEAVRRWASLDGWQLVVVGDRRTPRRWRHDGVVYLSPADQLELGLALGETLPWNHYSRKMLGYLYAVSQGAQVIADTDDDNLPLPGWAPLPFAGTFATAVTPGFFNVYRHFSSEPVWPRGYPLRRVRREPELPPQHVRARHRIGVWQFLAAGNPDVDAIYRLVSDRPVTFLDREPLVLDANVVCPFNSQNTVFARAAFPLLFLPALVTFRFTDILRGLVAQPILWAQGLRLGFGPATVVQERNEHDDLDDFRSEVPMYLHAETVSEVAAAETRAEASTAENLRAVYAALRARDIVEARELDLLERWLYDLASLARPAQEGAGPDREEIAA